MNDNPSPQEELSSRLTQVESVLMHLQHEVEQLNQAIIQQNTTVDALKKTMKSLDTRLGALEEEDEGRDPYQERPPHY